MDVLIIISPVITNHHSVRKRNERLGIHMNTYPFVIFPDKSDTYLYA